MWGILHSGGFLFLLLLFCEHFRGFTMKKSICILVLIGVSTSVQAEYVHDPICPLVEDAAMMVMAERQDGTPESKFRNSLDETLRKYSNIYSPMFIKTLKESIYPLIDAAYIVPVRDDEKDKIEEIKKFGLYGYETCIEELSLEIDE